MTEQGWACTVTVSEFSRATHFWPFTSSTVCSDKFEKEGVRAQGYTEYYQASVGLHILSRPSIIETYGAKCQMLKCRKKMQRNVVSGS